MILRIGKLKDTGKSFCLRERYVNYTQIVSREISNHTSRSTHKISKKDASVDSYWQVLKGALVGATHSSY